MLTAAAPLQHARRMTLAMLNKRTLHLMFVLVFCNCSYIYIFFKVRIKNLYSANYLGSSLHPVTKVYGDSTSGTDS